MQSSSKTPTSPKKLICTFDQNFDHDFQCLLPFFLNSASGVRSGKSASAEVSRMGME